MFNVFDQIHHIEIYVIFWLNQCWLLLFMTQFIKVYLGHFTFMLSTVNDFIVRIVEASYMSTYIGELSI